MAGEAVAKALTRAYDRAEERPMPAHEARIIVFSDMHKGARDGADDFQRCEPAYCAALAWYLAEGYSLYVLGDAEELWENSPGPVLARGRGYPEVLELEARFLLAGRYERFYGNHDDLWSHADAVKRWLRPLLPGVRVREALRLRLTGSNGTAGVVVFLHGHQGTADSDRWGFLSRLFVRSIWRPIQRRSGYTGVTPALDHALRSAHDREMAAWAGAHPDRPVLVAGHTHRPVFWDSTPAPAPAPPPGADDAERAADREWAAAERRNPPTALTLPAPCYFNSGCCCFGDGDVTGIEIAEGEFRLVRWPVAEGSPRRKILDHRSIDEVLDAVAGRPPAAVTGAEVAIVAPAPQ